MYIHFKVEDLQTYLCTTSRQLFTGKSQLENCTCDCSILGVHRMRQRYDSCCCSANCNFKFKVKICQKSNCIELLEPESQLRECPNGLNKEKKRKEIGVVESVKCLIENMCAEDTDITAKRISNKITVQRKEHNIPKSLLPTLRQVKMNKKVKRCVS